jgi:molecular chaperone HtpG
VDLSKIAAEDAALEEPADLSRLIPLLKDALKDEVSEVRATDRLVDSAVVLAAPEGGPDLHLQRLLQRAGRGFGGGMPVLEINPRHPLVRSLASRAEGEAGLGEAAGILLDLARVQDGDTPRDPVGFARRVAEAIAFSMR